jgi:CopG family transcriptional regulator / antitoxin EndoAI
MNTEKVRLNITLPKDLVALLNKIAGPRQRNRFIADSLKERIAGLEKVELQKKMKEGYQATAKEGIEITKEFQAADLENWDEY